MKKIIGILLFLLFSTFYNTQCNAQLSATVFDSLELPMKKQYKPVILNFSEKGKWAMVEKRYGIGADTIFVYKTEEKTKEKKRKNSRVVGYITYMRSSQTFLKEEGILSTGLGKAEFWNLANNQRTIYDDVKMTTAQPKIGRYSILDHSGQLSIFDSKGTLLYTLDGVQNLPVTDELEAVYVIRKQNDTYEIYDVSGKNPQKLYSGRLPLQSLEISSSGRYLIAIQENVSLSEKQAILINRKSGTVNRFELPSTKANTHFSFKEFGKNGALFIHGTTTVPRNKMVELWYGNDGKLIDHDLKTDFISKYWIYSVDSKKLIHLTDDQFSVLIPTGNDFQFLAFNPGELQNYETVPEDIDLHIFDSRNNTINAIDRVRKSEICLSADGELMVYRNKKQQWILMNFKNESKKIIDQKELKNPVFSEDGQELYFESETGLFIYTILKESLQELPATHGKQVRIMNKSNESLLPGYYDIFRTYLKKGSELMVEVTDTDSNQTSYITVKNNKSATILPFTSNHIDHLHYTSGVEQLVYVEENYNMPSSVIYKNRKTQRHNILLEPNKEDRGALSLKKEIIAFQNKEGKNLKGVLYYPAGFDPKRKYPMVVRIYQVQSNRSNYYYTYGYNNTTAFELRAMVERGYFVYLPDIVYGKMGTGLSALDCVNRSLDAMGNRSYINTKKIGLTGHSHGGYQTNFIATHSDRFAAYLSGAGNSDIVRSYFSYNYNFHSPFYWQFEDGQYEMPLSFVEDKELYFRNNPIHYVDRINAPMLLWAGKKDKNIAWDQVMEFYIALKRNQKDVIALFYPEQGHNLAQSSAEKKDLYRRHLEWWDYFLKDKKNIPWINKQMKKDAL